MRWLWLLCLALCPLWASAQTVWPQDANVYIVRSQGDAIEAWQVDSRHAKATRQDVNALATPLGSTWKLFVYAYMVDQHLPDVPYQCTGQSSEEKYCCSKGGSIGRDQALLQSCGLYFEPKRLGLQDAAWRSYWYQHKAPLWLTELGQVREQTVLPVRDVLWALQQVPDAPKQQAQQVLLNIWLRGDFSASLAPIGSQLRGKTLTMPHPQYPKQRIGGMAGWLTDGEAFWLLGRGNSHEVLQHSGQWLPALLQHWQPTRGLQDAHTQASEQCVEVDYLAFMTNPIVRIRHATNQQAVYGGVLPTGRYTVQLQNGRQVSLQSDGKVSVFQEGSHYRIRARMGMTEYVARVLEREAASTPEQAAKALSIAIRTYALNEASGSGTCLLMRDSTQQQRVLTQAASPAAAAIARSTEHLVLRGAHGHFQDASTQANVLGWQQAQAWARQGLGFQAILARAYPNASVAVAGNDLGERCSPLPQARKWLTVQLPRWHKVLQKEAGYRTLAQMASVCQLSRGTPYADVAANRVYIRQFKTETDQIVLAHEYMHLLFAQHPNGGNEAYVEALAQRLVKGQ